MRYSNYSDFSGELHLNNEEQNNDIGFKNGNEFLDGIEMKRKQNDAIYKATQKIQKTISRRTPTKLSKINSDNNDNNSDNSKNNENMETFNIEYINKKNDLQQNLISNKDTQEKININETNTNDTYNSKSTNIIRNHSRRSSKMFHDMEDKVLLAIEGQRQNCIRRHWFIFSIILILIIIILFYVFYYKK